MKKRRDLVINPRKGRKKRKAVRINLKYNLRIGGYNSRYFPFYIGIV